MPDNPLLDVQTWLYHLGDANDDTIEEIADGDFDLVVLEWASYAAEETPYTAEQLDAMRSDDDDLIVSYLSIGEAESYRYYWNTDEFQAVMDDFLDEENPEWEENFKVEYWNEDWQATIFDYLERIIDGGFNGVYLDIIDAYEYWEEEAPNSGTDYRQEMADFVAAIRSHAESYLAELGDDRTFVVIGQNGIELLENDTYLDAIDGVGKEDLQFYYENGNASDFEVLSDEDVEWAMDLLQLAVDAGKQVMVVEYVSGSRQNTYEDTIESLADQLWEMGIPLYIARNRDLDNIFSQPESVQYARLIEGSANAEVIIGTAYGDVIAALDGNDKVWAGGEDYASDVFVGGAGNDTIGGGPGHDLVIGGEADEGTISQALNHSGDTSDDGADRLFGGSGNDTLIGGSWDDSLVDDNGRYDTGEAIVSGTEANTIWAGAGEDIVIGAGGADRLGGGSGNDLIDGAGGNDTLYGGGGDTGASPNDTLNGGEGDDIIFASAGDDSLVGGEGDDTLYHGMGDDTVYGGDGADLIWMGPGNDIITGGAGADTFAFGANIGTDTITDFNSDEDILHIVSSSTGFQSAEDVQAAATEVEGGILIDLGSGNSLYLADVELGDLQSITYEFV